MLTILTVTDEGQPIFWKLNYRCILLFFQNKTKNSTVKFPLFNTLRTRTHTQKRTHSHICILLKKFPFLLTKTLFVQAKKCLILISRHTLTACSKCCAVHSCNVTRWRLQAFSDEILQWRHMKEYWLAYLIATAKRLLSAESLPLLWGSQVGRRSYL